MKDNIPPDNEPLQFPKIPGLGDTRNGHKLERITCADCVFFSVDLQNIQQGFCHANPPQMMKVGDNIMVLRPKVGISNIACRHLSVAPK